MADKYMPPTMVIRDAFVLRGRRAMMRDEIEAEGETFDRWLSAHDAEIRRDQAEKIKEQADLIAKYEAADVEASMAGETPWDWEQKFARQQAIIDAARSHASNQKVPNLILNRILWPHDAPAATPSPKTEQETE